MNVRLSKRIEAAVGAIERVRKHYSSPAFMCSFGKDSMVLLHILQHHCRWTPPIIFHRDPWWPKKYAFADRVIAEDELEVHDWPPLGMSLWEGETGLAFTNHYQVGPLPGGVLVMPKNILPPEPGKRYLCGLKDVLGRPTANFSYKWDCVFIGHKSTDTDPQAGNLTLACDIKQNAGVGPDLAFPLRSWNDGDVWDYTEEFGVRQQEDRYDISSRTERDDKTANSDYAHVCIACIDRREKSKSVHCPRLGCQVDVIADRAPYQAPKTNYYGADCATT